MAEAFANKRKKGLPIVSVLTSSLGQWFSFRILLMLLLEGAALYGVVQLYLGREELIGKTSMDAFQLAAKATLLGGFLFLLARSYSSAFIVEACYDGVNGKQLSFRQLLHAGFKGILPALSGQFVSCLLLGLIGGGLLYLFGHYWMSQEGLSVLELGALICVFAAVWTILPRAILAKGAIFHSIKSALLGFGGFIPSSIVAVTVFCAVGAFLRYGATEVTQFLALEVKFLSLAELQAQLIDLYRAFVSAEDGGAKFAALEKIDQFVAFVLPTLLLVHFAYSGCRLAATNFTAATWLRMPLTRPFQAGYRSLPVAGAGESVATAEKKTFVKEQEQKLSRPIWAGLKAEERQLDYRGPLVLQNLLALFGLALRLPIFVFVLSAVCLAVTVLAMGVALLFDEEVGVVVGLRFLIAGICLAPLMLAIMVCGFSKLARDWVNLRRCEFWVSIKEINLVDGIRAVVAFTISIPLMMLPVFVVAWFLPELEVLNHMQEWRYAGLPPLSDDSVVKLVLAWGLSLVLHIYLLPVLVGYIEGNGIDLGLGMQQFSENFLSGFVILGALTPVAVIYVTQLVRLVDIVRYWDQKYFFDLNEGWQAWPVAAGAVAACWGVFVLVLSVVSATNDRQSRDIATGRLSKILEIKPVSHIRAASAKDE